jgi:hypothetical protein
VVDQTVDEHTIASSRVGCMDTEDVRVGPRRHGPLAMARRPPHDHDLHDHARAPCGPRRSLRTCAAQAGAPSSTSESSTGRKCVLTTPGAIAPWSPLSSTAGTSCPANNAAACQWGYSTLRPTPR